MKFLHEKNPSHNNFKSPSVFILTTELDLPSVSNSAALPKITSADVGSFSYGIVKLTAINPKIRNNMAKNFK